VAGVTEENDVSAFAFTDGTRWTNQMQAWSKKLSSWEAYAESAVTESEPGVQNEKSPITSLY
jgi:hypothetical protein